MIMADLDDKIMKAFKRASDEGRRSLSIESLHMLTGSPPRDLIMRLNKMQEYGLVQSFEPSKKPTQWKFPNLE